MSSVIEHILAMKRKAAGHAVWLLEHPDVEVDAFRAHIRLYVMSKYLLEEDEYNGDCFEDMIDLSVEKSQRLPKGYSSSVDFPSGCDGTTSAVLKKALLFMAAQKDFGITIPPNETGKIKTTTQFADLIRELLAEKSRREAP